MSEKGESELRRTLEGALRDGAFAGYGIEVLLAALDAIPNPIFIKDPDARFLFFNEAYETAFGVAGRDYVGKTVLGLDFIPEEARGEFHREDTELISRGGTRHRELEIRYADGTDRTVLYWVTTFEVGREKDRGLLGMLVDISRQVALQKDLQSALRTASPISRIAEHVLLLPVTGLVDAQRGRQLQNDALAAIAATKSRLLIVDIGGVSTMDPTVSQALLNLSKATGLLGCRSLISGVTPDVAKTLVELHGGATELRTVGTLRDALKIAESS